MAITRLGFSEVETLNGRSVLVAAVATPGTLVHTAHATSRDFVYLDITNTDTVARKATVEFGGVTSPNDLVEKEIPAESTLRIISGWMLTNSLLVRVFGASASVLTANGFIQRIS